MKRYPLNPELGRMISHGSSDGAPSSGAARGDTASRPHAEDLLALADRISGQRQRRRSFFAPDLFSEPAWDMLLALFRADAAGHRMSVSNMCFASGGPETTALRWLDKLEELGMVKRRRNPLDARIVFIELQPHTRNHIHDYLMNTWVALYSPGTSKSDR